LSPPSRSSSSASRRGTIILISLAALYFLAFIHRTGVAVIAYDIANEFNTDATLLGLMSSTYFFPYAAAQIPVGLMLDRIGIRKTVTILSIIACVGNLIFALGPSIAAISLGRTLVGFGVGGFYVSALKAIAVWFRPGRFATLTGAVTSVGMVGAIASTSPLAVLSLSLGWRGSFLVVFGFMALLTMMAWLVIKGGGEKEGGYMSAGGILSDLRVVFTNRNFLRLIAVPFLAFGFFISFQGLWGGPFLGDVYGMDKAAMGNCLMMIGLGYIVAGPLAGLISDRLERRKPVMLGGLVLNLVFWAVMAAYGGGLGIYVYPAFFLLGAGFGCTNIFMTMSKEYFRPSICGTGMACFNVFNFVGAGVFQSLMGVIIDMTSAGVRTFASYQAVFIMCTAGIIVALAAAAVSRESYGCLDRPPSEGS